MMDRYLESVHTAVKRSIAAMPGLPLPRVLQRAQQACAASALESEIAEAAAFLATLGALRINRRRLSVCGQNFVRV